MNFETLRRIAELEKKVAELASQIEASGVSASELVAKAEALIKEKQQERRTLTLTKNNAGHRQTT